MAAVHFTTIPCEPNTAYKTQGKPYFYNIFPVLRTLCIVGLKILQPFCTFVPFYKSFRALRAVGKCTSRHLFSYGGLPFYPFRLPPMSVATLSGNLIESLDGDAGISLHCSNH